MKIVKSLVAIALVGIVTQNANAQLIDDFESGDLSAYTTTVILDTDEPGGANTSTLESVGGKITFNTTVFQSIEQIAITRSDVTLEIGQELQLDVVRGDDADRGLRGDQDFGLYVGGSTPVAGVRENYITVFQRHSGQDVQTAVFEGTTGNTNGFSADPSYDTLFIARTGADTYEGGFYDAGVRNVLRNELTIATDAGGPTIGFYADVRAAEVLSSGYDNLAIVPEPTTIALAGMAGLALCGLRRNK